MYPKNFARFYDAIYHTLRDGVDNRYFLDRIRETNGRILEVGVGTGRLFIEALRQGADIYGIDVSQTMIDVLKEKLGSIMQKRVYNQNIIDFNLQQKFDLVIAPFRVMMHLIEKEDQLRALNHVYQNLNRGGIFVFDVFIPDLKALITGVQNQVDFDGEYLPGKHLRRIVSTRPDLLNQIIHVNFRIEWDENGEIKTEDWDLPLRYFFRFELEHLVERSRFKSYSILGDYSGNLLNPDSKDYIVVCRK